MAACSNMTEKDLGNLESPNDIVKQEAIKKIANGEPYPLNLVNRFFYNGFVEKRAVEIMVGQLRDGKESEDIQLGILKALGELGQRTEVPVSPLVKRLRDENPRIRLQAVESLGKIRNPEAVPALIELLDIETNKYPIIWALGEIGDRTAVPALNRLLVSEDKYVRYNAGRALAKIR